MLRTARFEGGNALSSRRGKLGTGSEPGKERLLEFGVTQDNWAAQSRVTYDSWEEMC